MGKPKANQFSPFIIHWWWREGNLKGGQRKRKRDHMERDFNGGGQCLKKEDNMRGGANEKEWGSYKRGGWV